MEQVRIAEANKNSVEKLGIVAVELHSSCAASRRGCFEGIEREAAFLFTTPLTVSLEGLRCKDAT